jgi:hypothetical protein
MPVGMSLWRVLRWHRGDHVKEDPMYVSIGTILAIVLIVVLLAWLL